MTSNTAAEIPSAYTPADVEKRVYDNWLAKGYFAAKIDRDQTPYTIIMPPPNVNGELHLGHALEKAIEDALIRWRRMSGVPTLWMPGTDHAGIATQWSVEQLLAAEGKTPASGGSGQVRGTAMGARGQIRRHHPRAVTAPGYFRGLATSRIYPRPLGQSRQRATPSSIYSTRASSTAVSESLTGVRGAPPHCPTWR